MNEYDRRVTAWARKLLGEKGVPAGATVTIDAERGWGGGCDTCGYGEDRGGIRVLVDGREVYTFDFCDLDVVLTGILEVELDG